MTAAGASGVVLVSHGTVDDLDDLGAFVAKIRRGRPAPPELVAELRHRYEAIGGSPLNAINARLAAKVAVRLGGGTSVALANRLWQPAVRDVLSAMVNGGVERVVAVPLAQHSAHVYADDAKRAAEGLAVDLACAPGWGGRADLCACFATRIRATLEAIAVLDRTTLLMTAHSLPQAAVDAGDPYERDVRAAASAIELAVRASVGDGLHVDVAFQSQGFAGAGAWLGPDVTTALGRASARGDRHVVVAPVGFLADHVEVLYDLDVEARRTAEGMGLAYARTPSLNDDDDLVEVLAAVAAPLLGLPRSGPVRAHE